MFQKPFLRSELKFSTKLYIFSKISTLFFQLAYEIIVHYFRDETDAELEPGQNQFQYEFNPGQQKENFEF